MKLFSRLKDLTLRALLLPVVIGLQAGPAFSAPGPTAASTIDVCHDEVSGNWRYTGVVALSGAATDTSYVAIDYRIQNHTSSAGYGDVFGVPMLAPITLAATPVRIARFAIASAPLPLGTLRSASHISLANPLLPANAALVIESQAELAGPVCGCPQPTGCTRTQGYWSSKPGVSWPAPYSRTALFFSGGVSWQAILDTPPKGGNAYLILAHQYIAAVLNHASGASAPPSIQTVIANAASFFSSGSNLDSCTGSQCETQKNWAGILDTYNKGLYPGAPADCPD